MAVSTATDPRPLLGEPLGIDLVDTRWWDPEGTHDLLEDLDGFTTWLRSAGLDDEVAPTRAALIETVAARQAIVAHISGPVAPDATDALNAVLARGTLLRVLGEFGPTLELRVNHPAHLAGWRAAEDYLRLLEEDPTRIRQCANPSCILYFYDTSPNRTRRWCTMTICGNRAKSARHYARRKNGPAG